MLGRGRPFAACPPTNRGSVARELPGHFGDRDAGEQRRESVRSLVAGVRYMRMHAPCALGNREVLAHEGSRLCTRGPRPAPPSPDGGRIDQRETRDLARGEASARASEQLGAGFRRAAPRRARAA